MPTPSTSAACPCGGASYASCCGPYIAGDALPPTAEALMRSRYTAFTLRDEPYLRATWHASTRPARLELEPGIQWLGLDVRAHRVRDDTHAEVEFVARSRLGGGPARRLHERSRFVREREGGVERWFYVDGTLF